MELTQRRVGDRLELHISGRLDAYWAEHLDAELTELVRSGRHALCLNMAQVGFLSSAGIRVLLSHAKQLAGLGGSLRVLEPSVQVREVLELSGLSALFGAPPEAVETPAEAGAREIVAGDIRLHVEGQATPAHAEVIGDPTRLDGARFEQGDCVELTVGPTTLAIGIGALGEGWDDCHDRFGEFLAAAGIAACLPSGSEAAPDFMAAAGDYVPSIKALYAITCEMTAPLLVSFEPLESGGEIGLSALVAALCRVGGHEACATIIIGETTGLVGASLKRSPVGAAEGAPFDHPQVREWLSFTSEAAHCDALAVVVGFADVDGDVYNAAAVLHDGRLAGIYHKHYLPTYGVFDEDRYFRAGVTNPVFVRGDVTLGVSICEDIWYPEGPPQLQARGGAHLLLNLSASPYHAGKAAARERMLATRAADNVAVVAFCNLVGGQDELVFDGGSVVFDERGELLAISRQTVVIFD
mgnify:CR=1 FL=1